MAWLLRIVQHTPLWVVAVLVLLVVVGVQALRARSLPVWRLLLVPALFIGWGILSVAARAAVFPALIFVWLTAGAAGFAIAWLTTSLAGVGFDRTAGRVHVPGSAVPLIRNLAIFAARYCLGAAMAIAPTLQSSLLPWDIGVSGVSAGYFAGWLVRLGLAYRRADQPVAAPMHPTRTGSSG